MQATDKGTACNAVLEYIICSCISTAGLFFHCALHYYLCPRIYGTDQRSTVHVPFLSIEAHMHVVLFCCFIPITMIMASALMVMGDSYVHLHHHDHCRLC